MRTPITSLSLLTFSFLLCSCSLYQSQGRKDFESRGYPYPARVTASSADQLQSKEFVFTCQDLDFSETSGCQIEIYESAKMSIEIRRETKTDFCFSSDITKQDYALFGQSLTQELCLDFGPSSTQ